MKKAEYYIKTICWWWFLIIFLVTSGIATAENIVVNPGFESGATGCLDFGCSLTGVSYYLDDVEVLPPGPLLNSNATGQVIVSTVYQELEGFGASGAWYENWVTSHKKKSELYDVLFDELGLDIYRIRNLYDIGSMSYTQQIVAAAKSRNPMIKIMISSWTPPTNLKSNDNLVGGTLKKDAYGDYMYDEFADWWADSLDEYSSRGINADYINIQNEPNWVASWDTCLLDPIESATVAGYNEAFEAVWQKLNTEMGSAMPKMLAAEARNISLSGNYLDNLINDSHVYGYAHHLYGDGSGNNPDTYIPAMTSFASQYSDKPRFQTEYSDDETTFTDAINLAMLIHNSLTIEGVSVYMYWPLFWGGSGGLVTIPSYGSSSYTINHVYYALKQYSAFTNPGWSRVEASTDSSGLRISAFINPDVNLLTIVIINVSEIGINLTLSLTDFSQDYSTIYRTSETEDTASVGSFNESQPLLLPAESITTIILAGSFSLENCTDVQSAGYGFTSDINGDCYVNYIDLNKISDFWLFELCPFFDDCEGADFEPDADVDLLDFSTFATQWMQCNDPEDPNCTHNWEN